MGRTKLEGMKLEGFKMENHIVLPPALGMPSAALAGLLGLPPFGGPLTATTSHSSLKTEDNNPPVLSLPLTPGGIPTIPVRGQ